MPVETRYGNEPATGCCRLYRRADAHRSPNGFCNAGVYANPPRFHLVLVHTESSWFLGFAEDCVFRVFKFFHPAQVAVFLDQPPSLGEVLLG